jgi:hypothetical protein
MKQLGANNKKDLSKKGFMNDLQKLMDEAMKPSTSSANIMNSISKQSRSSKKEMSEKKVILNLLGGLGGGGDK